MAAPAIVACLCLSLNFASAREDDGKNAEAIANTVKLDIQISGLGAQGAKVEIKPAHAGCQFKTVEKVIEKGAKADAVKIEPFTVNASTTSPNRDCSFEITVTEPGRKPKTFRRGMQLTAPTAEIATPANTLKCYLPATTIAVKDQSKTRR